MQGNETYNTGTAQNTTAGAWSSSAQSIATVGGTGVTTVITAGQSNIEFLLDDVSVSAGTICAGRSPECPVASEMGASSPVNVMPCPSSVTLNSLTAVSITIDPTLHTGYGAIASMLSNPTIQDWSKAVIKEAVTQTSSSCPSSVSTFTNVALQNSTTFDVGATALLFDDASARYMAIYDWKATAKAATSRIISIRSGKCACRAGKLLLPSGYLKIFILSEHGGARGSIVVSRSRHTTQGTAAERAWSGAVSCRE